MDDGGTRLRAWAPSSPSIWRGMWGNVNSYIRGEFWHRKGKCEHVHFVRHGRARWKQNWSEDKHSNVVSKHTVWDTMSTSKSVIFLTVYVLLLYFERLLQRTANCPPLVWFSSIPPPEIIPSSNTMCSVIQYSNRIPGLLVRSFTCPFSWSVPTVYHTFITLNCNIRSFGRKGQCSVKTVMGADEGLRGNKT